MKISSKQQVISHLQEALSSTCMNAYAIYKTSSNKLFQTGHNSIESD